MLNSFDAFRREGAEIWGRDNRLGLLLDLLRVLGEEAGAIWDRLCGLIARDVLLPGDPYRNTVLMELSAARNRPGPALPRRTTQIIDDWTLLREHFEKATDVPESSRRAVIDACNRLHFDSMDVLHHYFERFILPQGVNRAVLDDFVGFFHSFFLAGMDHQDYSSRSIAWLQIVTVCPDETQRRLTSVITWKTMFRVSSGRGWPRRRMKRADCCPPFSRRFSRTNHKLRRKRPCQSRHRHKQPQSMSFSRCAASVWRRSRRAARVGRETIGLAVVDDRGWRSGGVADRVLPAPDPAGSGDGSLCSRGPRFGRERGPPVGGTVRVGFARAAADQGDRRSSSGQGVVGLLVTGSGVRADRGRRRRPGRAPRH